MTCWGDDWDGSTLAPAGTFKHVSTAGFAACGITTADVPHLTSHVPFFERFEGNTGMTREEAIVLLRSLRAYTGGWLPVPPEEEPE